MKIALIIDYLKTGGAERQALTTAVELNRVGHCVEIITYRDDAEFKEFIAGNSISIVPIKANGFTRIDRIWALARHLRRGQFDVVYAFKGTATIFAALAAQIAGIKPVFGGYRAEYVQGTLFKIIHRCIDRLLCGWIVNSQTIADSMSAAVGIDGDRFFIVYNSINPVTFASGLSHQDAKTGIGISAGDHVVTQVARLSPEKNHALFLDMAALLLQQRSDVQFLIVGDGPQRGTLESRAHALGISGRVRFLGTRSDIPDILRATDVSVLTSDREGFPNALIESMCMGIPVVTTDYPAASELIRDGQQGFIVPRNNPAALAEKVQVLLNDRALSARMGDAGRTMAKERFSPAAMATSMVSAYQAGMKKLAPDMRKNVGALQ
jgi:glycosyltransferase involved in cell wall biosynthesis